MEEAEARRILGTDVSAGPARSEVALRDSLIAMHAVLETAVDAIITIDEQGRIQTFNKAAERLFGYSVEEAAGNNVRMLMPSPYREEHDAYISSYLTTGVKKIIGIGREVVGRRKDGTVFPIELAVSEVRLSDRRLFTGIVRDLTERKQAEEMRLWMAAIVQSSNDAIIAQTLDGVIIAWNDGARKIYGYTAEEAIGQNVSILLPPDRPDDVPEILERLLRGERVERLETARRCKAGAEILVSLTVSLIRDPAGRLIGVSTIARDVTEQRRAEAALAAEKELLAVTLRSIADGVITADVDGRVVLLNRVAEILTGWTQAEAHGQPFTEVFRIVEERGGEPWPDPVARILEHREPEALREPVLIARDGRRRRIVQSCAPICDRKSRPFGVVLAFRDVTEELMREEELLKSQKLESIGLLAGGIAHDFNNLLGEILCNVTLARMSIDPGQEASTVLAEAERAFARARDLTQQLLTFAKGWVPLKKVARLGGLLRDTAGFALSGSRARYELSVPEGLWPVEIDEGQISQVLNNLLINADQAMPGGGTIRLSAENVTLDGGSGYPLPPGRYVRILVRDEGIGIPREHLPKILDPYFTTKQKGSGLGLTTAYSILRRHEGHIHVESELGAGTSFWMFLPASGQAAPPEAQQQDRPVQGQGRILLMDDSEGIRNATVKVLRRLGYEVETAADGAEALALYRSALLSGRRFDAVILDLTIPGGLGGKEAIAQLRQIDPEVRAIAASGYSTDPVLARFREFGFHGIIAKPFGRQELGQVLHSVLSQP